MLAYVGRRSALGQDSISVCVHIILCTPRCSRLGVLFVFVLIVRFRTLFRMQAPNSAIGTKLVRLMSHYGWTKFVHLYRFVCEWTISLCDKQVYRGGLPFHHSASAFGQAFVNPVKAVAEELNMELLLQERFYELSENSNYTTPLLNVAATKAKVILVTGENHSVLSGILG